MREIAKAPPEERKPLVEALQTAYPKKSSKPKSKTAAKPTVSAESRKSALATIQKISEELARPKPPLTLQGAVQQFEWKVTLTLEDFDGIFNSWPQLDKKFYDMEVCLWMILRILFAAMFMNRLTCVLAMM